jgi:hypothetical protein
MSTKFTQNLVGTTLVLTMLVLGSIFGYAALGGSQESPANAVIPTTSTSTCVLCAGEIGPGGGGTLPVGVGGVGVLPTP